METMTLVDDGNEIVFTGRPIANGTHWHAMAMGINVKTGDDPKKVIIETARLLGCYFSENAYWKEA
jgi:hypothetical protein